MCQWFYRASTEQWGERRSLSGSEWEETNGICCGERCITLEQQRDKHKTYMLASQSLKPAQGAFIDIKYMPSPQANSVSSCLLEEVQQHLLEHTGPTIPRLQHWVYGILLEGHYFQAPYRQLKTLLKRALPPCLLPRWSCCQDEFWTLLFVRWRKFHSWFWPISIIVHVSFILNCIHFAQLVQSNFRIGRSGRAASLSSKILLAFQQHNA